MGPVSVPLRAGNFRLLSPLGPPHLRFPVAIIEMPPLVFLDGKTSGFHLPAQEVAQTASFRGAAGIGMRVRTFRLNDELARVRSPQRLCAVRAE
jgi:hypothetical protein